MTHKFFLTSAFGIGLLSSTASAASVSISGLIETPFFDEGGSNPLVDGSIVQIGFLLGLDPALDLSDPGNAGTIDWSSFTALTGFGSGNSTGAADTRINSFNGPGTFGSFGLTFESSDGGDFGNPTEIPVRIAIRVFDSTDSVNAKYNTYTSSDSAFILEDPSALDPNSGRADFSIASTADPGLIWEGTPFQTTVAIPEPSTSLSALLGLALLAGARRRK